MSNRERDGGEASTVVILQLQKRIRILNLENEKLYAENSTLRKQVVYLSDAR